jgi:ribulose-phosphate 3-epimerase
MTELYPAILTESLATFRQQLAMLVENEDTQTVHIDIMDGFFVDALTVSPADLSEMEFGQLKLDLHLMVDEPLDYVYEAEELKAKLPIRSMIAQIEHMSHPQSYVQEVKKHGWKVGLALDVHTPIEEIPDEVWKDLDIVQLMAVEAGAQGSEFQSLVFAKIDELKLKLSEFSSKAQIYIDGGLDEQTLPQILATKPAGVIVGSAIWTADQPEMALAELEKLVTAS